MLTYLWRVLGFEAGSHVTQAGLDLHLSLRLAFNS